MARDLKTLRERKKELGFTNREVADLSGIPLGTVQKFFSGATRSPGSRTLLAIERALYPKETPDPENAEGSGTAPDPKRDTFRYETVKNADMLCESVAAYGNTEPKEPEGGYTYADYVALPDDRRVELIDGQFYDMAAPNSRHQIIIGQLYVQFQACMENHPECMVLLSPLDVMLDGNDRTVMQPDLLVVCDKSKLRKGRVFGAPDLVIEVISPGSRKMDYGKKAGKYIDAGVREYWIIDYARRCVIVYRIEDDMKIAMMSTEDDIPVGISKGTCTIRMKPIQDLLDSLGEI